MTEEQVERLLRSTLLVPAPPTVRPNHPCEPKPIHSWHRRILAVAGLLLAAVALWAVLRRFPEEAKPSQNPPEPVLENDVALRDPEIVDAVLAGDDFRAGISLSSAGFDEKGVMIEGWICPSKGAPVDRSPENLEKLIATSRKFDEREVVLTGNRQVVTCVHIEKTPGEYLLIFKARPLAGEKNLRNNYVIHTLRVVDETLRVLYVEGVPRYEHRFLKNALLRDPKVRAQIFLTIADKEFPQEHSRDAEPLQEFPRDLKSLLEYDVLIYGDVDPAVLGPGAARLIETYVTEFGGGIIFISGSRNNPRALIGTALANLLPVVPGELAPEEGPGPVKYRLTADGHTSPITNFRDFRGDRDRNHAHWEKELPDVRYYQRIRKLKPAATALVEVAGDSTPLFATLYAGRGRVFWSGTDETWLWRYRVGDEPWFYPFWQQAMGWVREGKFVGRRYRISTDKDTYGVGDRVLVFANAYTEQFLPESKREIEAFASTPQGKQFRVMLAKDSKRDGYYEGEFHPPVEGDYSVWISEKGPMRASAGFYVAPKPK